MLKHCLVTVEIHGVDDVRHTIFGHNICPIFSFVQKSNEKKKKMDEEKNNRKKMRVRAK